jgi:hypothetical protein
MRDEYYPAFARRGIEPDILFHHSTGKRKTLLDGDYKGSLRNFTVRKDGHPVLNCNTFLPLPYNVLK